MTRSAKHTLICADAFEWLAHRRGKSIQAVVTDPPFGVEYSAVELTKSRNGSGGNWRLPRKYDGHERRPSPRFTVLTPTEMNQVQGFHARLAPLLYKVLVPGGHVIIASQNLVSYAMVTEFASAGFEIRGQIARIVKTLRGGDRPKGAHKDYPEVSVIPRSWWEPWVVFRRPCEGRIRDNLAKWGTGALRRPSENVPFSDLIESSPVRGEEKQVAGHPSQKPQAFMRQLVRASLPLGKGTVLDPFMGSGSTIAAAKNLGFRSIGLECDLHFFEMAAAAVPRLAVLSTNGVGAVTKQS